MIQPKLGLKFSRTFLAAFIFISSLFIGQPAVATPTQGLTQDVYTYDSASTPDRVEYTLCNTSIVPNINFDVGGDTVANCQADFVLIHWTGYITLPVDGEITFQSLADDGFYMSIGDSVVIDNWWLKGCSGGTGTAELESGVSQKVDIWWYEYGGGACNYLYYTDPVTAFTLIPDSAWSTEPVEILPPVIIEPTPIPVDPVEPPVVEPPVDPTPVDPVDPPVVDPIPEPPIEPEPVVIPPVVVPEPPVVPEIPVVIPEPKPIIGSQEIPVIIEDLMQIDLTSVDPTELTKAQAEQLVEAALETFETATEGSPEYQQALDALYLAAEQDDIVVDEELANTPVIGATVVAFANAINFLGNIGADISPKVREKSQKVVVGAIIVGQIAQVAGTVSVSRIRREGK